MFRGVNPSATTRPRRPYRAGEGCIYKKDGGACRHAIPEFLSLHSFKMARLDALLACVFALSPLVSSQFLDPTTKRQQFRVGEPKTIRYNTKLTNYTIAIWQQAVAGGSATLGPVVVRESPPNLG